MTPKGDMDDPQHLIRIADLTTSAYLATHPRMRPWRDDLLSDASLGVWQARLNYDPNRGACFETYAITRARGAILDGIRQRAPLTRGQARANVPHPLSLDQLVSAGLSLHDLIPAQRDPRMDALENTDAVQWVLHALPEPLAEILLAVDLHGETLVSYGRRHGYTESRASQIRRVALRFARRLLDASP